MNKGNETISIRVEDDGPGVPENQLNNLGQRGVRLDEQKQGTGLGLAIARDVSEAYDGTLSFDPSPLGGLAVTVQIPGSQ
jgi:signal transduction histidine kinase